MKWHPATRLKLSFVLLTGGIIAALAGYILIPTQNPLKQNVSVSMQLGFYDLMLRQKELYDTRMITSGNTIQSNITSPNDNQFVLKGNFTRIRQQGNQHYFSYRPVYFMPSQNSRILDGNLDLLSQTPFWIQQTEASDTPLMSMPNGMIYLYPLEDR
ncbi:hypothetical protein ACUY4R_000327 [Kosakonia sp. BK9b]|uniref:hypothetical protein n=1 Tax=Kosakonia sp. TaxID=1916651 RepID=UPI0028A2A6B9|nr:hypothetical protein [Kosakonia sp.]